LNSGPHDCSAGEHSFFALVILLVESHPFCLGPVSDCDSPTYIPK
jgi:hypothetical protein